MGVRRGVQRCLDVVGGGPDGQQRECPQHLGDRDHGRAGDAAIQPEDVHVRLPVDWDSVDPIPDALAEIMARPGTVNPPLDDVVPGEPEHAGQPQPVGRR